MKSQRARKGTETIWNWPPLKSRASFSASTLGQFVSPTSTCISAPVRASRLRQRRNESARSCWESLPSSADLGGLLWQVSFQSNRPAAVPNPNSEPTKLDNCSNRSA